MNPWQLLLVSVVGGVAAGAIAGLGFASSSGLAIIGGSVVGGISALALFVALIALGVKMGNESARR